MKKIIKKASSSSNTKIKNIDETITLAPSELDYKPKKCERCFYLEKNYKIAPKDFPPPVFSRFDVVQQAYYKDKNTSVIHYNQISIQNEIIKHIEKIDKQKEKQQSQLGNGQVALQAG